MKKIKLSLVLLSFASVSAFAAERLPKDLQAAGKDALKLLSQSLSNSDARVRSQAARSWGIIGNPAAIPVLKQALRDQDDSVRIAAAYSLFELKSFSGVPILKSIIRQSSQSSSDSSPVAELRRIAHDKMRVLAIRKLFAIEGKKSEALLRSLLDDPSGEVRDAAAVGLARMGLSDFVSEFISALGSMEVPVRVAAARDLGDIGTPEALEGLTRAALDPAVDVREEVMRVLPQFPAAESAPLLTRALKDEDPRVRAQALVGLSLLSDSSSIPALKKILEDSLNSDTRLEAETGLARRGQKVDLNLPERILSASDPDLKNLALNVLGADNSFHSDHLLADVVKSNADIRLRIKAATFLLQHIAGRKGS
jgi:HEAT repeat protein